MRHLSVSTVGNLSARKACLLVSGRLRKNAATWQRQPQCCRVLPEISAHCAATTVSRDVPQMGTTGETRCSEELGHGLSASGQLCGCRRSYRRPLRDFPSLSNRHDPQAVCISCCLTATSSENPFHRIR